MIKLYTTHCPKCKILATKLQDRNIPYDVEDNKDIVTAFGVEHNILSVPILVVDDEIMDFSTAIKWVNTRS